MNNSKKSFYLSWGIGLGFSLTALVFLILGWTGYGLSLFCILPIALGITSGILPDKKWAIYGGILATVIFIILLVVGKIEGFVCVLMALPIVACFVFLGYLIVGIAKKITKNDQPNLKIVAYPFLLFVFGSLTEVFWGNSFEKSSVSNFMVIPDSRMEVYQKIINVDTVDVETGFLQNIGLPTPRKCILSEEKIGGKRICVFEEGTIIETIKEFKKGEMLKMDVSDYNLPGAGWLKFDEDIYTIENMGGNTKITRTTTYSSQLKPRFYWKMIENITISAEQDFVFRNLKKDLAKN